MKNKDEIRARLTIYHHEELKGKELRFFKKWILAVATELQAHKAGNLSKIFRATLYKHRGGLDNNH